MEGLDLDVVAGRYIDWKGMKFVEDNSDEVAGSGSDPDVDPTSIGRVGSDVTSKKDWKGWIRRQLEGLDPSAIGRVGSGRHCWKGRQLEGLEGTSIGRIRSMLLLLIVPTNDVVVDC